MFLALKPVLNADLKTYIILRITNFLHNRLQFFGNRHFLELSLSYAGSSQSCVLSPLLYILHTDDCRSNHEDRYLLTFGDDRSTVPTSGI